MFFVSGEARQGARPLRRDQERRDGAARPREGEARPLCPTLSPRGPTRLSRAAAVRSAGSIGPFARARRAREAREARAQEVDREPAQARRRGVGALAAAQRDGDRAHRPDVARGAARHGGAARADRYLQPRDRPRVQAGARYPPQTRTAFLWPVLVPHGTIPQHGMPRRAVP